ncbi:MAG: glycosyltransferase family 2 protein [Sphingomonadaceae bacterium]
MKFRTNNLRVAVILASTGRPDSLGMVASSFLEQSQLPSRIILSVVSQEDLPANLASLDGVEAVSGPKGLPAQRNTGLRQLGMDADVVAFFDDDYIPSHYCIEGIARFFAAHDNVAGASGHLLADGINSAGIAPDAAEAMIARYDVAPARDVDIIMDLHGLYGCNMAYRLSATENVWFDERLKLYGWQEDIDFANQIARKGRTVSTHAFAGVHLGEKGGRTSGVRLGYSQIANPVYLNRKGTMDTGFALRLIARNVSANHVRSFWPEPWVDRAGRVKGNWLAVMDLLRGRVTPERIERL